MLAYPIPSNEAARSQSVGALNLMRRRGDSFFDAAIAQVRAIFGTPIAFISLFEGEDQTFLARDNVPFEGTPRDQSLCAYTVAAGRTISIPDTALDPRSREHPIVTNPPHVRCSISAPVRLSTGFCIGTLCAIDLVPRDAPSEAQIAQLEGLATMVARFYEVPLEPDAAHAAALRRIARTAQEEFLDLIGHELRTPLNGIVGLGQMIEPADEAQAELVDALNASADRLEQVIENIVAYTGLTSGEMALEEAEFDLRQTLQDLIKEYGALARIAGKTVTLAPGADAVVLADAPKIGLALSCLLANVIAHGGGNATMTLDAEESGVRIRVCDDGPGIAPEEEARIWQAFSVGGGLRGRAADGIGLGLPLTRRIVDMHGGDLTVLTDHGGLTATIHLPAWRLGARAP